MKKFYIDIAYVVSVIDRKEHRIKRWIGETEADFLIRKLSSDNSPVFSISSEDHPEFAKLREQLGTEGYIEIQRNSWNGDRAIKPFTLNGVMFDTGDRFLCAAAIKYDLTHGKTSY
jgi:hypothetical protein